MELILWRHAEAEDGMPDSARELTKHGRRQSAQIAAWLQERIPENCEILVSPAKRTRQTADALGLPYVITKHVGIGASAEDLLTAAGWPERNGSVLVVGHQPTLGHAAARILSGAVADWSVKKGALWWFSSRTRHGGETVLKAVVTPEIV